MDDLNQQRVEFEHVRDATNKRLEQRAELLEKSEQDFNQRVIDAADILAKAMRSLPP